MGLKKFRDIERPSHRTYYLEDGKKKLVFRRGGKEDSCLIYPPYDVYRVVWDMKNGCHSDRPIVVTTNTREDGSINYSAQCACDGPWCTTGCNTPEKALDHYRRMTQGEILYLPEGYIL